MILVMFLTGIGCGKIKAKLHHESPTSFWLFDRSLEFGCEELRCVTTYKFTVVAYNRDSN